jgi:beta-glucanase (GH16 family)
MCRLQRLVAAALVWISAAGCTLNYFTAPRLDLSQAVLTFEDNFDGTAVDEAKWRVVDQNLNANGAVNAYNPAMVSVSDGLLAIQVQRVPWMDKPYSGGELDSLHRQTFQYGYFEARIKCPKGSGLHCSWWLWPDDNDWPPEIDIVEIRGNLPTQAMLTIHWQEPGAPPSAMFEEVSADGHDFTADFHVYGVEWAPNRLVWFLDGIEQHRTTEHVPQKPFRLQLDLALDEYAGGIDMTTALPASMLVDYVRVYRMPDDQRIGSRGEGAAHPE